MPLSSESVTIPRGVFVIGGALVGILGLGGGLVANWASGQTQVAVLRTEVSHLQSALVALSATLNSTEARLSAVASQLNERLITIERNDDRQNMLLNSRYNTDLPSSHQEGRQ